MKPDFVQVVRENTSWLLSYVRQSVKNNDIAEDLVQEVFIKAYRSYDSYEESGQLRGWLKTIARNTVYNYYASPQNTHVHLSLDVGIEEDEGNGSLYDIIPDTAQTPEEELLHRELVDNVMRALASMPPPQRMVLTYRYIDGLSVEQTAIRMGIPQGSVKSSTYYALQNIRSKLGVDRASASIRQRSGEKTRSKKAHSKKGDKIMKCTEIYRYLFQYAMDKLPAELKTEVAAHIETCSACSDIVTALRNLIPHLPEGRVGELTHYNIDFPEINICYSNVGSHYENAEILNEILDKNNGCVPEGEIWFGGGSGTGVSLLAMFDNEGFPMEYIISEGWNSEHYRYDVRKLRKIYDPINWGHSVFEDKIGYDKPQQSYDAPNLYTGRVSNALGNNGNSGIYIALPTNATNVRIKRGNGVIDCGPYQFVYSQRYVIDSETLWLEYTYNM